MGTKIGYVNIIENGIANSLEKVKQVKDQEFILSIKLKGSLALEARLGKNETHGFKQIQLRPAIAVWKKKSKQIISLINKHNIAYAINLTHLPEINKEDGQLLLAQCQRKIKQYKTKDSLLDFLEDEIFLKNEVNNQELFKLIMGYNNKFTGDLRGAIAEVMSKYILSQNIPSGIKLTNNLSIEYERIQIDTKGANIGYQKEFDFVLTTNQVKYFKEFMNNLYGQNMEVIKNKQYLPTILTPTMQF
jgi:hypothetical protein